MLRVLNHEADHALSYFENPQEHITRGRTKDNQYGNKEEKRVITGSEQETAKKLGEIKEGQVTRTDHQGQEYPTKGPTTTEGKNVVIVRPQKNKKNEN